MIWSPLPAGSPTVPHNRPRYYYPGSRWVDWAGTDFYADNQDWKALYGLYRRYSDKPFAITEWSVDTGDDSAYVRKLMTWVDRHRRTKMLVYYQDFGSTSSYRIAELAGQPRRAAQPDPQRPLPLLRPVPAEGAAAAARRRGRS